MRLRHGTRHSIGVLEFLGYCGYDSRRITHLEASGTSELRIDLRLLDRSRNAKGAKDSENFIMQLHLTDTHRFPIQSAGDNDLAGTFHEAEDEAEQWPVRSSVFNHSAAVDSTDLNHGLNMLPSQLQVVFNAGLIKLEHVRELLIIWRSQSGSSQTLDMNFTSSFLGLFLPRSYQTIDQLTKCQIRKRRPKPSEHEMNTVPQERRMLRPCRRRSSTGSAPMPILSLITP